LKPDTFHISLYDAAFFGTALLGFSFALQLWFAKKDSRIANRFLALALVVVALWMGRLLATNLGFKPIPQFLLALGPLLFLYVFKLTRPERKFGLKDWLHFIPVIVAQALTSAAFIQWSAFISVSIYLGWSHSLIRNFYSRQQYHNSDRYRHQLRWLQQLLFAFGLLWLLWIPFILLGISFGLLYLLLAALMIWMAVVAQFRSEPEFMPVKPTQVRQKGSWVKSTVKAKRYYEDPDLSLSSLAEKLGINPHELSPIINTSLKKSFADFVNEFRVRNIITKMQDPAYNHLTLLGIAFESGFNSKSNFNRAFKQVTGKNPVDYKKEAHYYNIGRSVPAATIISDKINRNPMFKNYLKIAWRQLIKNKMHSFINVAGLAVGMVVAMLIGLWIWDELSFDRYHQNYDTVGQLMTTQTANGETQTFQSTVVPLSNELRFKYPGDFKRVALTWESAHILAVGDTKISQTGMWAEPDLPAILSLVMIKGSYGSFKEPTSLLLSASVAKALFGDDEPINKVIRVDNDRSMKVAGVYQDLPHNTTLNQLAFILPWGSPANWWNTQSAAWSNHGCHLFVQLNPNTNFNKISEQIRNITKPHFKINDETMQVFPMSKWHLYSEFQNGKSVGGRIQLVWLIGIIGVFVLLLACINFMNLSTARSEKRAKEVGIRKAIGSVRSQLIKQFLSESMLVVFIALVLTIAIAQLAIPYFNGIADKQVTMPWGNPLFWLLTLGFTFFTGLVSGSYPAFYLSGFKAIKVLKGTFKVGRLASVPRKVLVVVQFTVSITLIIGTIVVFRQIQYAGNRPVGYTREGLITVEMNTPQIYGHYEVMRNDLIQTGAVKDMAESNSAATQVWSNNSGFTWDGMAPGTDPTFGTIAVTPDFGNTVGWTIIEGRDFSRSYPADTGAFILNESAVRLSGIKNPIGKTMRWQGKDHVITGVVKDMVMESPYKAPVATVFHMDPGWANVITIRVNPTISMTSALKKIEGVFKIYNPGSPFSYKFVDDEYAKKFSDEQKMGNLATVFAVLAVFISCLGLFGMASFIAEQRIKEIGVRKVLGATVFNLWHLLSTDFVLLVAISLIIATPVAYYFMHNWLQSYAYRTEISWWIFALTGLGAMLITLATVSYQSIKAALANPVKSLKTE
jgi:putative ABC transport system permease protein